MNSADSNKANLNDSGNANSGNANSSNANSSNANSNSANLNKAEFREQEDAVARVLGAGERALRAPFVVAVFLAAPALLLLGAAAPGGDWWRLLEFPARITAVALVLALWAGRGRSATAAAAVVVVGTPVIYFLWDVIREWLAIRELEHSGSSLFRGQSFHMEWDITVRTTFVTAAPWLVGAAGAWVAAMTVARKRGAGDAADVNRGRAALWATVMGAAVAVMCLVNRSWATLENLTERGTYRSSVAWPDTKVIALAVAVATVCAGAAWMRAVGRRRAERRVLLEKIRRGEIAGWRVVVATGAEAESLPVLIDGDEGKTDGVLVWEKAGAAGYREGGVRREVARVVVAAVGVGASARVP